MTQRYPTMVRSCKVCNIKTVALMQELNLAMHFFFSKPVSSSYVHVNVTNSVKLRFEAAEARYPLCECGLAIRSNRPTPWIKF